MYYHFTMGKLTETELEKAIIELCEQQGYNYVCGEDMHRKFEDILLLDDFRSYLNSRYQGLSDTLIDHRFIFLSVQSDSVSGVSAFISNSAYSVISL